jgi:chromosome segregation ATPase
MSNSSFDELLSAFVALRSIEKDRLKNSYSAIGGMENELNNNRILSCELDDELDEIYEIEELIEEIRESVENLEWINEEIEEKLNERSELIREIEGKEKQLESISAILSNKTKSLRRRF